MKMIDIPAEQLKELTTCIEKHKAYSFGDGQLNINYVPSDNGYEFSVSYERDTDKMQNFIDAQNAYNLYLDKLIGAGIYNDLIEQLEPGILKELNKGFEEQDAELVEESLEIFKTIVNTYLESKIDSMYKEIKMLKSLRS